MIEIKTFSQALPILAEHGITPTPIGNRLWSVGAMQYDKGGIIALARSKLTPDAPAALSSEMQSIARNYLGARQRAGAAWLETARYLAEARAAAKYGEWKIFLEATQTSADIADRLLAIHEQSERDPQYRLAIQNNFLNVSTAYELTTAPPAARAQLLSQETPPTRQQIRDAKQVANSAPARTFDQAAMFDAPPAAERMALVAAHQVELADMQQRFARLGWKLTPHGLWFKLNKPDGTLHATETTLAAHMPHLQTLEREAQPADPEPMPPVGFAATPHTPFNCVRCGSPRSENRHLTTYETDLVPEYPGRSVTLCSSCIPELLRERKQALARLDEQLPPLLFKAGYFWKLANPPTLAHYDGWHGDAPTIEQALQLGRDHLRKKTENDPRLQAAQLLKQLEPLLLALSQPAQERLSMAISDLNECPEGTEVQHWLAVGAVLIGGESEER